jgi:hypothetical protein
MRLRDKVIIVTGGTSGIGRAIAERAVFEGARVVVHGIERSDGEAVVAQLGRSAALHLDDLIDAARRNRRRRRLLARRRITANQRRGGGHGTVLLDWAKSQQDRSEIALWCRMPKLAAFPKAYMNALVRDGTMTLREWVDLAAPLGVDGLEERLRGVALRYFCDLGRSRRRQLAGDLDAVSLLPLFTGGKITTAKARELYFARRDGGPLAGKTYEALIRGDWQRMQNDPFSPFELYNLREDPGEKHNVIAQQAAVANELKAALRAHI